MEYQLKIEHSTGEKLSLASSIAGVILNAKLFVACTRRNEEYLTWI